MSESAQRTTGDPPRRRPAPRAAEPAVLAEEATETLLPLAEKRGSYERYADALVQRAGAIYDAVVAKDLFVRLGRVAEEKLKDDRRSVEAYATTLGVTPAHLTAMRAHLLTPA